MGHLLMNDRTGANNKSILRVSLLTAGKDTPYVLGLLSGLVSKPISVDVIGNDEMRDQGVMKAETVTYYNFRENQDAAVPLTTKLVRVLKYYARLARYAATTDSQIFHILWLNRFTYFDRTFLNLYYKLMAKKLVFTAHNVNSGERDGDDSVLNRLSLTFLYKIVDRVVVHTPKMKEQLVREFGINEQRITVMPFGVNNTLPTSKVTKIESRERLGLDNKEKVILFFGNIAPYKGLDIVVKALPELRKKGTMPKLLIAGQLKDSKGKSYWEDVEKVIEEHTLNGQIIRRVQYIPDMDVEFYFKAADVLILPYRHVFQSGVLFLAYSFGLPVIAADVGSLKHDILEGSTGFVCKAENPEDLAEKIAMYFDSELYRNSDANRDKIARYANETYSWEKGGDLTYSLYASLL
jgi:glycosyltransferase involved in cell wall biosynthesis